MNQIAIWGESRQTGAYVLEILANEEQSLSLGRFHGGRPVRVCACRYAYVGSAMGRNGATALAGRLLRHATRSGEKPPHAIREMMASVFGAVGLGGVSSRLPTGKRLHWHVDYLLDEMTVELARVMVIRTEARVESDLARRLAALPGVRPLLPGLGAADAPGETHLLRIADTISLQTAVDDFFSTLIDLPTGDPDYNRRQGKSNQMK